ncbi:unnamed protein product [Medioppia subpectinata]|uniref:C2H2-type domain-containing protein n=1 Tax=Medioppia subpectinata TaxID=1979941 RepID=A0A7R9KRN3_9ACAR|nr:unnamed protein product [Medioppia subpectinata]CAG2108479.1 unnamed protein product [Medioppia subpectinata]
MDTAMASMDTTLGHNHPMDNQFVCFVDIYDTKYRLMLSHVKSLYVSFCRLYEEIIKIDTKNDLSFHSNTFEVLDTEEQGFKRITSFGQLIPNESRIRVLLKPQIFHNYLQTNAAFDRINSYESNDYRNKGLDQSVDTTLPPTPSSSSLATDLYMNSFIDNKSNSYATSDSHLSAGGQYWTPSTAAVIAGQPLPSPSVGCAPPDPSLGIGVIGATRVSAQSLPTPPASQTYCPNVIEYSSDRQSNYSLDINTNYSTNCTQNQLLTNVSTSDLSASINSHRSEPTNEFDINLVKNLIETQMQSLQKEKTLQELREEGVEMKQNFNFEIYLCKVCDECFQTPDSALTHTASAGHLANKSGNFTDDLDKQLVIPSERLSEIAVVLARKQEMRKLDLKTKYQYLRHGVRIKDGVGNDAFVCLVCKVSFQSPNHVRHHLEKFEPNFVEEHEVVYTSTTFKGIIASQDKPFGPPQRPYNSGTSTTNTDGTAKRRRSRKRKRTRRPRSPQRSHREIDRKDIEIKTETVRRVTQTDRKEADIDRKPRDIDLRDSRERRENMDAEIERRQKARRERRDRERQRDSHRDRDDREFTLY